jgi:FkbM family methyltransferase
VTRFSLADYRLHNTGRLEGEGPVRISTPPQQWAYAVEFPAQPEPTPSATAIVVTVDLTVYSGAVGVACVGADGTILVEREYDSGDGDMAADLSLPSGAPCGALIVRNAYPDGAASQVEIRSITVSDATDEACPEITLDPAVWAPFASWSGVAPAGYLVNWLGVRTCADLRGTTAERPPYSEERWETHELSTDNQDAPEWDSLLMACRTARDTFVAAAIGAGWGKWLSAAAAVASQTGRDYRLIGVEAEPTHFAWLLRHLDDNGIDRARCRLFEAAARGRPGACWFRVGRPVEWWGQSIAGEDEVGAGGDSPLGTIVEARDGTPLRRTRTVDLDEALAGLDRVDYLQIDIQGSELELLSAGAGLLRERVRIVTVATHSERIDRGLRRLFTSLGWASRYDVPLGGAVRLRVGSAAPVRVPFEDGLQVWINPALEERTPGR